jgi:hypothetical protein
VSAACAHGASDPLFVDSTRGELIKAVPELSTLDFDSDQSKLDPLLRSTGQRLESTLAKLVNVSLVS